MPESPHRVRSIPPLLLKVGIPKSLCGCILECNLLCTIFGVTLTLTSSLSRPRVSCPEQISENFVFGCIMVLLIVAYYIGVTMTLTSDFGLLKSCAEHISYTTWQTNPILGIHVGVVERLHTILSCMKGFIVEL